MSATGKQSPLGINVTGAILQNQGLTINPAVKTYLGTSTTNTDYTPGTIVGSTCLKYLAYAISGAYNGGQISSTTYNNLISIGAGTIPALGNSKAPTYVINDPSGNWTGIATTGYYLDSVAGSGVGQSKTATWLPYDTTNPNVSVTQWGFLRLFALQAWNEFNWNGIPAAAGMPEYKDFTASFLTAQGFIDGANKPVTVAKNSVTFAQGTYSNMNDLMTANIAGVNLATFEFGQDCVTAGKIIDLSKIALFGLPSVLLQTITKYNALTQAVALALIASGISTQRITAIANGSTASKLEQQQIYGAFLVIGGTDLKDVLVPLNCKTKGLNTLADLLNVKKIFPNSYQSLTVPVYNTTATPTNSKTYYPIFEGGAVSPRLSSPAIVSQIGTITVPGEPPINAAPLSNSIQVPSQGFGSYLTAILPDDIATSTGAFSYSMQQITNIFSVDFEKFAQAVYSLETTKGLNLINGTSVPANVGIAQQVTTTAALGSGPNGSYTMSDFFGCMSGLPYMWGDIYSGISQLQTSALADTYLTLYLVGTWAQAQVAIDYTYDPFPGTELYTVNSITLVFPGGGYGFGGAAAPTITSNCTSGTSTTIGTNPNDLTTYGKVTSITFTIDAPQASIPTFVIDVPPNGPTYPNSVVQTYIDSANAQIAAIQAANPTVAKNLNTAYNAAGTQLMIEQRARYAGISPVPGPTRSIWINPYPSSLYVFVDAISNIALNTAPHMYAQTLEAISDLSTVGGESIVALMRQERNQIRLQQIGLELDNNIPDGTDDKIARILLANGTVPTALSGITVSGINGDSTDTTFTIPSSLIQTDSNGNIITPSPLGYFDPNNETYCLTGGTSTLGDTSPMQNILAAANNNVNNTNILGPELNGTGPAIVDPIVAISAGAVVPVGPCLQDLDVGKAEEPGSLAGSDSSDLIPPALNMAYASATLTPSIFRVSEAIDNVILCNCDCWVD